jgi:hypothetical protein
MNTTVSGLFILIVVMVYIITINTGNMFNIIIMTVIILTIRHLKYSCYYILIGKLVPDPKHKLEGSGLAKEELLSQIDPTLQIWRSAIRLRVGLDSCFSCARSTFHSDAHILHILQTIIMYHGMSFLIRICNQVHNQRPAGNMASIASFENLALVRGKNLGQSSWVRQESNPAPVTQVFQSEGC